MRPGLTVSVDSEAALLSVALVDYGRSGGGHIIIRGWMNLLNRSLLTESEPLVPGQRYDVSFEPNPTDHVFTEENRLDVMIYSIDSEHTKRPPSSPTLTLHLNETVVTEHWAQSYLLGETSVPVKRVLQSPTALVTLLVTVIWVFGYAIGASWWPIAISVGYAVGIPISATFLETEPSSGGNSESVSDDTTGQIDERDKTRSETNSTADALETVRERYAAGDLSETQFETKLEQLLETETVEDASAYVETSDTDNSRRGHGGELSRETKHEVERE